MGGEVGGPKNREKKEKKREREKERERKRERENVNVNVFMLLNVTYIFTTGLYERYLQQLSKYEKISLVSFVNASVGITHIPDFFYFFYHRSQNSYVS